MPVINPSEFKQVIRFEKFTGSQNSSGGFSENFQAFFSTKAKWEFLDGSRILDQIGRERMVTTARVTCYWRSVLEAEMNKNIRITYDNKFWRMENLPQRIGEQRQYYQFRVSEAN